MLAQVLGDLAVESALLRGWVAELDPAGWATPTPAPGWTVAHQIAHLTWTDEATTAAVDAAGPASGPAARRWDEVVAGATADPAGFVDAGAAGLVGLPPPELLHRWDDARAAVADALRRVGPSTPLPWFGPPMKATSMATARFMETWAHGLDVAAALGRTAEPSDRIRHVCHLGVLTRRFAYGVHGRPVPDAAVFLALDSPGGDVWTWGDPSAEQRITGPAWDFARVAVRRRHPADTALVAVGADAQEWLTLIQAFAGPPGADPARAPAPPR